MNGATNKHKMVFVILLQKFYIKNGVLFKMYRRQLTILNL